VEASVAFLDEAGPIAIGRRLREFRKARDISQRQAAKLFDVSERTYVRWENAHKRPATRYHRALHRAFSRYTAGFLWDPTLESYQPKIAKGEPARATASRRFFHVG